MKYYRVVVDGVRDPSTGYETIYNELITEREKEKKFPRLKNTVFEHVNVSRRAVYWLFGARFQNGTGSNYDQNGYFTINGNKKVYCN